MGINKAQATAMVQAASTLLNSHSLTNRETIQQILDHADLTTGLALYTPHNRKRVASPDWCVKLFVIDKPATSEEISLENLWHYSTFALSPMTSFANSLVSMDLRHEWFGMASQHVLSRLAIILDISVASEKTGRGFAFSDMMQQLKAAVNAWPEDEACEHDFLVTDNMLKQCWSSWIFPASTLEQKPVPTPAAEPTHV